jgi:hypothetical protein
MDERRKIQRFHLEIPARIKRVGEGQTGEVSDFKTRDISSSGAFLFTDEQVAEGAHLTLELVLPVEKFKQLLGPHSKVRINVSGRVIRKDQEGIAVLFNKKYEIRASANNSH